MAAALVCGMLIALFYDIYWLLVAWRRSPFWLRALQDILLALVVFCLIGALWLYLTGGVLRPAVYVWMLIGLMLFRASLSRPLRRLRPRAKLPETLFCPSASPPQAQQFGRIPAAVPNLLKRCRVLVSTFMLGLGLVFWRSLARLATFNKKNTGL